MGIVTIDIKNNIASVRLNRPEKYNALNPEMFKAIIEAGETLLNDPSVRAVVLSGEGKGFCAGLDFQSFMEMKDTKTEDLDLFGNPEGTPANYAQYPAYIWKQIQVPVIAAIHGVAFGGGLQIALGADIRLASKDARFSVMEIKWGLIPDMSLTQTLCDLVRLDVAKELTFTGKIVDAEEAARLGLITRVCDNPLVEAEALAKEIAGKSPHAIAAGKQLLENAWNSSAEEGLKLEESFQRPLLGSPNQLEAIMSNLENRPSKYKGREEGD